MDLLQSTIATLVIPTDTFAVGQVIFNDPGNVGAQTVAINPSGAVSGIIGVTTPNTPAAGSTLCVFGPAAVFAGGQWTFVLQTGGGAFVDRQTYNGNTQPPAAGSIFADSSGGFFNALTFGNPTAGIATVTTTALSTAVLGPYACYVNDVNGTKIGQVTGRIVATLSGGLDAAGVRAAVGLGAANLDAQLAGVLSAIATRAAPGNAMTLTGGERDAIANALLDLASAVESGVTPRQALRLLGSVLGGVIVQTAPGVWQFKGAGVATARVTASIPGDGSRPSMILTL